MPFYAEVISQVRLIKGYGSISPGLNQPETKQACTKSNQASCNPSGNNITGIMNSEVDSGIGDENSPGNNQWGEIPVPVPEYNYEKYGNRHIIGCMC